MISLFTFAIEIILNISSLLLLFYPNFISDCPLLPTSLHISELFPLCEGINCGIIFFCQSKTHFIFIWKIWCYTHKHWSMCYMLDARHFKTSDRQCRDTTSWFKSVSSWYTFDIIGAGVYINIWSLNQYLPLREDNSLFVQRQNCACWIYHYVNYFNKILRNGDFA